MPGITSVPTDAEKVGRKPTDNPFFLAVRARGVLNAMLDLPSKKFDELHKDAGLRSRWEWAPPGGDMTMVVAREAMGYRIVRHEELGPPTESSTKTGPVKVGDLVLMCAPNELIDELEAADAQAALDDLNLPVETYRQHLESLMVQTKAGEVFRGKAIGRVRTTMEEQQINLGNERG